MKAGHEWPQRAAIAGGTLVTFARALPYPLQQSWDDGRFILDNPDVQHVSADGLARMFTQVQFEAYHPLHLLSYWLDVPWVHSNSLVIHVVSLGLWLLALLCVYELLRALEISAWAAVAATLACGLHPVQVEAVSWASGRKDILALLLSAASLLAHVRARSAWSPLAWTARVSYALALLAKTTALPLPLLAFNLDVFARGVPLRQAALRQLPSLLLGLMVSACVLSIWGEYSMLRSTSGGFELAPLRFVQTLGHQLLTTFWPARTAPMYATESVSTFAWDRGAAVLLYACACVLAHRKRQGLVFAGLLGFTWMVLPVSNIVPLYFPLQDRYLSLPLLPLCMAFAGLLDALASGVTSRRRRVAATVLALAAVGALAMRTWQYEGVWRDEIHLWGHAASTQPDSDYAWLKLGEVRRDAGQLEAAIAAYRAAIHVAPSRRLAHAALFEAVALRDEHRATLHPSAARSFAQRYYEQLDHPEALRELAQALMSRGYLRAPELPMQTALLQDPLPDAVLERAAMTSLRADRPSLAIFYARMMRRPPTSDPVKGLLTRAHFSVLP
jgi:tetratricopeptide (TPR) repeat protein